MIDDHKLGEMRLPSLPRGTPKNGFKSPSLQSSQNRLIPWNTQSLWIQKIIKSILSFITHLYFEFPTFGSLVFSSESRVLQFLKVRFISGNAHPRVLTSSYLLSLQIISKIHFIFISWYRKHQSEIKCVCENMLFCKILYF